MNIQVLEHAKDLPLPSYATSGAAAVDLRAAVKESLILVPGKAVLVPTGIVLQLPPSMKAMVLGRSGAALKSGIQAHIGLIDPDYLGEISVLLFNHGSQDFVIRRGDRVAQLLFSSFQRVTINLVDGIDVTQTERGNKGFGSSGSA